MSEDVVIKEYNDGINWYKIYQSGKLEQGTKIYSASSTKIVNFPVNFSNTEYETFVSNVPMYTPQKFYMNKSAKMSFKDEITTLKEHQIPQYEMEILSKAEFKVNCDVDRGFFEWFSKGYLDVETYILNINVTPSDATVIINGVERTSFTGTSGVMVNYSINKSGYDNVNESIILSKDIDIDVELTLTDSYTITIIPGPVDSKVMLNDKERSKIKLPIGETAYWEVSKDGYVTEIGSTVVDMDKSIQVNLSKEMTVTFEALPDDAEIILVGE